MGTPITFNELRRIKDQLPEGSMGVIAARLGVDPETVRNFFGGTDFDKGKHDPRRGPRDHRQGGEG